MLDKDKIIDYYDNSATGAYARWGGPTRSLHFGYYSAGFTPDGLEPEDIAEAHFASLAKTGEIVLDMAGITRGSKLLDAGCGTGGLSRLASHRGAHCVGVNIAPGQLAKANNDSYPIPKPNFVRSDFYSLPIATKSIDGVAFLETLTHAPNKASVLEEATRVLKSGSKLVIADYSILNSTSDQEAVTQVNTGWVLNIEPFTTVISILLKLGLTRLTSTNTTKNMQPSFDLAANSAKAHSGEIAAEAVMRHREATIKFAQLMSSGVLGYFMIEATKA